MAVRVITRGPTTALRRHEDERGEVASWLILAAALAGIALLTGPIIEPIMTELASHVGGDGAAAGTAHDGDFVERIDGGPPGTGGPGAGGVPSNPYGYDPIRVSPSEEADEALENIIEQVDKGDDLGLSNDELNDVHSMLASLTDDELTYVLSNLSDQQLERIFHNAYSESFWSNDWDDGERERFHENLLRANQAQRNRIAAALADIDTISNGDYLEILRALEVDVSYGDKPLGAAIDVLIQAAIDPSYIDQPIADGLTAAGRVIIVNDEDYERAWREHISDRSEANQLAAAKVYENSRGFVDDEGRLWVQNSESETAGTPIHEAVHGYSDDALVKQAEALNEGVTEYFTREVLQTLDDPATPNDEAQDAIDERGYDQNFQFVQGLVGVVGEDAVATAYFDGDMGALQDAYIAATNRTEEDFDAMLDLVDGRSTADWSAAFDYLTEVTP